MKKLNVLRIILNIVVFISSLAIIFQIGFVLSIYSIIKSTTYTLTYSGIAFVGVAVLGMLYSWFGITEYLEEKQKSNKKVMVKNKKGKKINGK